MKYPLIRVLLISVFMLIQMRKRIDLYENIKYHGNINSNELNAEIKY